MYDRNAKKIIIPEGTVEIKTEEFSDFKFLEEVVLPNSIKYIGQYAFSNCTSLKKINLPNGLRVLGAYAFAGCESLEEITIPTSIYVFDEGLFKDCKKLKKLNIHDNIQYIADYALYNCESLENFDIPPKADGLGEKALFGCKKIKVIHIPACMDSIGIGALAYMDSLEKIIIAEDNEKFFSDDDSEVLVDARGIILQYAINSKKEDFTSSYYVETFGVDGNNQPIESYSLIYNIADYAFAGAKHLTKFVLPSATESIGCNTFADCDNLKDLECFFVEYGANFSMDIRGGFREEAKIPFKKITIAEGVTTIGEDMQDLFAEATEVSLPSTLQFIGKKTFAKAKKLKKLDLPSGMMIISPDTFDDNIIVNIPDFGEFKGSDIITLQTKVSDDYEVSYANKDMIRILSLASGAFLVKIDDFDTIRINKDEIGSVTTNADQANEKNDSHVNDILSLFRIDCSNWLTSIWLDEDLEKTYQDFANNVNPIETIVKYNKNLVIKKLMEDYGIDDERFFEQVVKRKIGFIDLKLLLEHYNESMSRFFRFCPLPEGKDFKDFNVNVNRLILYTQLLEKYHKYDKFLYNLVIIRAFNGKNVEPFIKSFNKNIKNILIASGTLDDDYGENLADFLNFCYAFGVFADDPIVSQRSACFINEKMLNEKKSNGSPNTHRCVGDTIHSRFSEIKPREELDHEFIKFFMKYYEQLTDVEKGASGTIARIYNNFRYISKSSTSHKGSQRHLEVTLDKCLDYFMVNKFDGSTSDNKKLASILQAYYSEKWILLLAEKILEQSKKAPRNIFTKIRYDANGNPSYTHRKKDDLFEINPNGFSYHWLPKQDYDNLILGKYCNCCAHLLGNGAGIMRASMILDCCQNLVIRNKQNEIIAKMTIYVNREQGYAVFNTTEISELYRSEEDLAEIYAAFMRGANRFVDEYNKNNKIPIKIVSIGAYRNVLISNLGNQEVPLLETPNYSDFGYYAGGNNYGKYDGDSKQSQLLVLKR